MASDKIGCKISGCKWEGHVIASHLKTHTHGEDYKKLERTLTPAEYAVKYGAPIVSERGKAALARLHNPISDLMEYEPRETEEADMGKLFELPKHLTPKSGLIMQRFKEPTRFTPRRDKRYVFPAAETKILLLGLHLKERNRVWIGGYSGTGKTDLVLNACSLLNHELFRVTMDSTVSRSELVGEYVVHKGEMVFQYGILPIAMKRGATLLIDEIDSANPHTLNVLRSVLEDRPQLVLLEKGGEVVKASPGFRVVATANTFGKGDDSGLFQTTHTISVADRQRFSVYVRLDYMPPEMEKKVLIGRVSAITDELANRFLQVAGRLRDAHVKGELSESFSPRQLINWAEKYVILGNEQLAARVCFLDSWAEHEQVAVSEIIKTAWVPVATNGD